MFHFEKYNNGRGESKSNKWMFLRKIFESSKNICTFLKVTISCCFADTKSHSGLDCNLHQLFTLLTSPLNTGLDMKRKLAHWGSSLCPILTNQRNIPFHRIRSDSHLELFENIRLEWHISRNDAKFR